MTLQHNLLEPDILAAVEQDGVPRQARYLTTYEDGRKVETLHMLWRDAGLVRSCLLADWPTEQAALALRDQERQKRAALRDSIQAAARTHVGKRADQLTLPELRDLFLVFLEREGMLDSEGRIA